MGWKDLSYWLKGGIILVFIFIVALLYLKFIPINFFHEYVIIFILPLFILVWRAGDPLSFVESILPLSLSIIFYFILGAIIGFIVGKIKNRSKK